jgi:hypothetical protein
LWLHDIFNPVKLPEKKRDWKQNHYDTFRAMRGWRPGFLDNYPVDFDTSFLDAGIIPSFLPITTHKSPHTLKSAFLVSLSLLLKAIV